MGCFSRKDEDLRSMRAEQKWDYINLNDFKSASCFASFSYFILFLDVLKSIAVYGVDTFTAVNLLAFSRWASQIKPKIPISISKWIFAGCIILSFVLLVYRWLRAIRVIKSDGVAPCYLDPIAVRVQSFRLGSKGKGWRRFLVFAELTKSKKGAEYVALFTYFNFEAWLRVIFAEGPRQVINGITLYSVMELNLIPKGEHAAPDGTSAVQQFFINIEALADKDTLQAVILFAMLFTVVIWVFTFLSLIISLIFYILFLWHHVPSEDGSLSAYCRRKINTRLERIVKKKVDTALSRGVALQDRKPTDLEHGTTSFKRQPTLPTLGYGNDAPPPEMPNLSRTTTSTTLPPYSRPQTSNTDHQAGFQRQPQLPDLNWAGHDKSMGGSSHHPTLSDDKSPLVANAGEPSYNPSDRYDYMTGNQTVPPIERKGTPLSLMSGPTAPPSAYDRRTPGPPAESIGRRTPGMEAQGYTMESTFPPHPPPSAAGRRTPGHPGPNRSATPGFALQSSTPRPSPGYRPFQYEDDRNMRGPPRPSPSAPPDPNARPNYSRPPPMPRGATAPPPSHDDPSMYNHRF